MIYLAIFHSQTHNTLLATQSCPLSSVGPQSVYCMPLLLPLEHLLCDYLNEVVLIGRLCRKLSLNIS